MVGEASGSRCGLDKIILAHRIRPHSHPGISEVNRPHAAVVEHIQQTSKQLFSTRHRNVLKNDKRGDQIKFARNRRQVVISFNKFEILDADVVGPQPSFLQHASGDVNAYRTLTAFGERND